MIHGWVFSAEPGVSKYYCVRCRNPGLYTTDPFLKLLQSKLLNRKIPLIQGSERLNKQRRLFSTVSCYFGGVVVIFKQNISTFCFFFKGTNKKLNSDYRLSRAKFQQDTSSSKSTPYYLIILHLTKRNAQG